MTVVVLDSNSFPHGHFSVSALARLLETAGRGASIVVPEVVVWEWAEHAYAAQAALETVVRQYRVDTAIFVRRAISSVQPIDEVVEKIETLLRGKAEVWRAPSDIWRESLRQQVLQTGSGERKKDVKTGAADAVVLACVGDKSIPRRALWFF